MIPGRRRRASLPTPRKAHTIRSNAMASELVAARQVVDWWRDACTGNGEAAGPSPTWRLELVADSADSGKTNPGESTAAHIKAPVRLGASGPGIHSSDVPIRIPHQADSASAVREALPPWRFSRPWEDRTWPSSGRRRIWCSHAVSSAAAHRPPSSPPAVAWPAPSASDRRTWQEPSSPVHLLPRRSVEPASSGLASSASTAWGEPSLPELEARQVGRLPVLGPVRTVLAAVPAPGHLGPSHPLRRKRSGRPVQAPSHKDCSSKRTVRCRS